MTKFESTIKNLSYTQEQVYAKLSDLTNMEEMKEQMSQDKVENLTFDKDTLSFNAPPVGQITFSIVEREPQKCIKFETLNSPLPLNLWIQILPVDEESSKMKVTIAAELNPFIKGMVQKPLQEGAEKIADMLSGLSY